MRVGPGLTALVIGDAATVDAVRAAVAPVGYRVHAITDVDELDGVPTAIRSDAFAIVLDTSKATADRLVTRIWGLVGEDVHCVIVSDEADAFSLPESAPWETVLPKPIDVDALRVALDLIWDMLDLEPDHPLRPGEEEERRRYDEECREMHRLLVADLERRTMLAETETPEETHSLDFFEMLFGDDNAGDGKVPVSEYRALRAVPGTWPPTSPPGPACASTPGGYLRSSARSAGGAEGACDEAQLVSSGPRLSPGCSGNASPRAASTSSRGASSRRCRPTLHSPAFR